MIKSNTVVIVGDLNPAIFSPAWIRANIDLTVDDGSDPEVQIIHSEIADFMLADIRFTVERNRIIIRSLLHDVELLVAISQQMFGDVLSHTPIWAYGINFERHIDFETFEKRNALGRMLCPLDPWGDWAKDFDNKDPQLNGGMSSITMKKVYNKDPEIYEMFTIQPSNQKGYQDSGVFFQINNHFGQLSDRDKFDEKFRATLLTSMRENIGDYVKNFEAGINHFLAWGGIK
ncbi:hypothetical protein [Rhizobium leguminosarum]|uniref:hypothetical protein n=1 Tax=Rhizobium leguminosarum TaxID=384 RepID=UPI0016160D3F|nr:hypothetical protein [Rhizobium leguminosarum]MBB4341382.1 hypothetical protein [Rhizobium leguminosarum]MBB6294006.1 hypothetical protein [Rhizobium leguminosarum]